VGQRVDLEKNRGRVPWQSFLSVLIIFCKERFELMTKTRLGLPSQIRACLFDLDGVLTQTASLHARAWQRMFDQFLQTRAASGGEPFVAFDLIRDYDEYVDGKPREDGIRSFLASRSIELPEGTPQDPSSADTVHGLGKRKNDIFLGLMSKWGVDAYPNSVRYLKAVRQARLLTAVVSSSENCREALIAAGIVHLFDVRIDGVVAARRNLAGKPAPDTYLQAAEALGVAPAEAAVYEDALAGVEAGRAGGFGFIVGVDRMGQAEELRARGAHVVVEDLGELMEAQ
jgi:beta-phosphoglucomutase family hydrolase